MNVLIPSVKNCKLAPFYTGLGSYIFGNSVRHTLLCKFSVVDANLQTDLGLNLSKDFAATQPAFFQAQIQAGISFTDNRNIEKIKTNIALFNNIELFTSSVN